MKAGPQARRRTLPEIKVEGQPESDLQGGTTRMQQGGTGGRILNVSWPGRGCGPVEGPVRSSWPAPSGLRGPIQPIGGPTGQSRPGRSHAPARGACEPSRSVADEWNRAWRAGEASCQKVTCGAELRVHNQASSSKSRWQLAGPMWQSAWQQRRGRRGGGRAWGRAGRDRPVQRALCSWRVREAMTRGVRGWTEWQNIRAQYPIQVSRALAVRPSKILQPSRRVR